MKVEPAGRKSEEFPRALHSAVILINEEAVVSPIVGTEGRLPTRLIDKVPRVAGVRTVLPFKRFQRRWQVNCVRRTLVDGRINQSSNLYAVAFGKWNKRFHVQLVTQPSDRRKPNGLILVLQQLPNSLGIGATKHIA